MITEIDHKRPRWQGSESVSSGEEFPKKPCLIQIWLLFTPASAGSVSANAHIGGFSYLILSDPNPIPHATNGCYHVAQPAHRRPNPHVYQ